jgi:hypothetical protein
MTLKSCAATEVNDEGERVPSVSLHDIKDHYDWLQTIYASQSLWPECVRKTYCYRRTIYVKDISELNKICTFLEIGAIHGVLVYRRLPLGFSWVATDEQAYTRFYNESDPDISKKFEVVKNDDRTYELISRKTLRHHLRYLKTSPTTPTT